MSARAYIPLNNFCGIGCARVEADRLCTQNRGDRRCCEPQATGRDNKTRAILLHCLGIDRTVFNTLDFDESSEARRVCLTGVSGQRPEQGADATFLAQQKTWAQGPYPVQ
jgi:hypothetical protein